MTRLPLTLAALLLTGSAAAEPFVLTEVVTQPIQGPQLVELQNVSNVPQGLNGWFVGVQFTFWPVQGAVTVPPGGFVRVHVGVFGTDTTTDVFAPGLPPLDAVDDSVSLWLPSTPFPAGFNEPENVVDYVQWGAPNQPSVFPAWLGGEWSLKEAFAAAPGAGQSLAYDGVGTEAGDWFRDGSPTLGGPNVNLGSDVTTTGFSCAITALQPILGVPSHPALGNQEFRVGLFDPYVPGGTLWVGLGAANIPIGGAFGHPCFFLVNPGPGLIAVPFTMPPEGGFEIPFPVPDDAALLGVGVAMQFVAASPFLPNALRASNGVLVTF